MTIKGSAEDGFFTIEEHIALKKMENNTMIIKILGLLAVMIFILIMGVSSEIFPIRESISDRLLTGLLALEGTIIVVFTSRIKG